MPEVGQGFVPIKPDLSNFGKDLSSGIAQQDGAAKTAGAGIGKTIAAAVGGAFVAKKVFDIAGSAVGAFDDSRKVAAQTAAVIKSTGGAAGLTEKDIESLAGSLSKMSGVDDELIQSGENVLATFTSISKDAFAPATSAALDMSVALGQDMQSSVVQVGKALQDPIKGVAALSEVGVNFTDQQKDQIKTMVESGDTLGAQKVILKELSKEFGGSAKAQATAAGKAKVAMGNLSESIGGLLVPVLDKAATVGTKVVDFLTNLNGPGKAAVGLVAGLAGAVIALNIAQKAWAAVTEAVTVAQAALSAVMAASPIVLVVLLIAGLVAALVIAYQKSETFRDIVQGAFNVVKTAAEVLWNAIKTAMDFVVGAFKGVVDWLGNNWDVVLTILTGPIGAVILLWRRFGDDIIGFFSGVPGAIGRVLGGLKDVLIAPFRLGFNFIARLWNNTIGKLSFKVPSWVPFGLGGKGWDVPDIPLWGEGGAGQGDLVRNIGAFAKGGVITRPTVGLLGEVASARPEIVTPAGLMRDIVRQESGGGGPRLNVEHLSINNYGPPLDGVDAAGRRLNRVALRLAGF